MAEIMFETFNTPALYMREQPYLAMFSYGATSGIIVDVGERINVVPLEQGYVFEKGISELKHGGSTVTERMQRMMSQRGHRFFSDTEHYIARLVKERTAFIAPNFAEANKMATAGRLQEGTVDARRFAVPDKTKLFKLTGERFQASEGLFDPSVWGKDNVGVHELCKKALDSAPIDLRKGLARNIYLSGGTTKMPGFAERLETSLQKLLPASSDVTVHAGEYREHAAYRGAAVVASLNNFDKMCISQEDWHEMGDKALSKFREDMERPPEGLMYDGDEYSDSDDDDDDDDNSGGGGGGDDVSCTTNPHLLTSARIFF
jgi:actin beta/gamma 1